LHPPLPEAADELLAVWGENWEGLDEKQDNVDLIIAYTKITLRNTINRRK